MCCQRIKCYHHVSGSNFYCMFQSGFGIGKERILHTSNWNWKAVTTIWSLDAIVVWGGALSSVEVFPPCFSLSFCPSLCLSLLFLLLCLPVILPLSTDSYHLSGSDKPFPYAWYCSKLFFMMTFSSGFAVLGERQLVSNCIENQWLKQAEKKIWDSFLIPFFFFLNIPRASHWAQGYGFGLVTESGRSWRVPVS